MLWKHDGIKISYGILKGIKVRKQVAIQLVIAPALAPVSSNTCSKMHLQIKHSLAHLQDLISILADIKNN